ncbi:MAG: peptide deformylase [Eubacteriales bacterium]|nr:peptide deformylase [Eubacteriales bacterium]
MAIRNIRITGDELLRKKSRPVTEVNDRIKDILNDMSETMYAADGVGLAAPQVGILRRLVVIDIGDGLVKLVNPEIVESEGSEVSTEACLSVPDMMGDVTRPVKVRVKAQDENGNELDITAEGLYKKALCHEIDHLDGILYTDRAVNMRRQDSEASEEEKEEE